MAGDSSDSEEEDSEGEQQQKDLQTNGREESSVEAMQQAKSRVPATLSISHILSGASRDDQQHPEGAKMREGPAPQGTPQGIPSMHPAAARQVIRSPDNRDRLGPSNEQLNRVPGKGPFENVPGRVSYDNVHGRGPYGVTPNDSLERVGLGSHGDPRRHESHEHAFGMKFNDRKLLGNVAESVIKKAPQNSTSDSSLYRRMPELRPIKESDVEDKQSRERTLENVSENGHLDPGKTESVPQRMPSADMNKHLKEGERSAAAYKGWPGVQAGSFLQELNEAGPPTAGNIGDKSELGKNHRLPFTSMLRGISPSQGSPENRGQYLSLDAGSRERMMAGKYLHSPEEKHERFNPGRAADMSAYAAMYANKRPSEMMPPLQYRPNLSAMAHQRNMESAQMPPGANSQFVDLNSVQYRTFPSGLPARESLTREQMYFLEQQQRRQQMASSMDAMMAGGQPERVIGYGGMLRQQQLFNAAYASHMRNGEFPGFPNEGERSRVYSCTILLSRTYILSTR